MFVITRVDLGFRAGNHHVKLNAETNKYIEDEKNY